MMVVCDEHFVVRWPENLPMDAGAPLLCAGITTYSPLRYYGLDKPGMHIGIVGLGGVGHVAVKMAKAFGTKVTVISANINKKKEAIEKLGADNFLVCSDQDQMQEARATLDGIVDTVSAVQPLVPLLDIMVGAPEKSLVVPASPLLQGRKLIGGSSIGGLKETQEMIDFAAKHGVIPEVEIIPIDYVNTAIERLEKADVKYRFVIDVEKTMKASF
ncbi:8-hydroxygeraniol dehydrogenase-like [Coffea arabica]|uniref:8-hydroxygeraniol dehydrogenase-like n=1 Tax=Coffea arabica TaxID=13443 RepID=A0ABM4V4Q6_COFAR